MCSVETNEALTGGRLPGHCVWWCDAQGEGEQQGEWKPPPPEVLATRRILKAKRPGRGAAKAADGATAPSPFGGISLTAPAPAANPFAAVSLTTPAAPAVATAAPTAGSPDVPAAAADAAEPSAAEAAEPSPAKAAAASPAPPAAPDSSPAPSPTAAAAAASFAVPSTSTLGLFGQKHDEAAASNTASLSALASTTTPAPFAGAGSMWTGGGFGSLSGKSGFGTSGAGFGATAAAASTSSAADAASTAVRTLRSLGSLLRDTPEMRLRHTSNRVSARSSSVPPRWQLTWGDESDDVFLRQAAPGSAFSFGTLGAAGTSGFPSLQSVFGANKAVSLFKESEGAVADADADAAVSAAAPATKPLVQVCYHPVA